MASAIGDLALVERILNHDPETIRTTVSERYFPKHDPKSGGSIYIFGFGWTKSPHMVAHQFEHPEVFALLMQRSPNWLRLINAAEVGEEAYFQRILYRPSAAISEAFIQCRPSHHRRGVAQQHPRRPSASLGRLACRRSNGERPDRPPLRGLARQYRNGSGPHHP